jgi:hypothetical protein
MFANSITVFYTLSSTKGSQKVLGIVALLEASAESFFWNIPEFGPRIRLDVLQGWETCPLRSIVSAGNSHKLLSARAGGCGGWVMI